MDVWSCRRGVVQEDEMFQQRPFAGFPKINFSLCHVDVCDLQNHLLVARDGMGDEGGGNAATAN